MRARRGARVLTIGAVSAAAAVFGTAAVSWARQLPFTGTNTVDLLTAGLLSLIFGAVLMSAGRRRGDAA
jgi:hypothetical protein